MTNTIFKDISFRSLCIIEIYCIDKLNFYEKAELRKELYKRTKDNNIKNKR